MSAVFAYLRCSTADQETDNQKLEIVNAGYKVDYWFADVGVSGKTKAVDRPQWSRLLDKIRDGETIIVSKIDRLGRDAADVLFTVNSLAERKVKVLVLQLGSTDLTSSTGKLLLTMLAAVAEMERSLLVERTLAGLARAREEGTRLGRPRKTTKAQRLEIVEKLTSGVSVSQCAREFSISRASVIAIREAAKRTSLMFSDALSLSHNVVATERSVFV